MATVVCPLDRLPREGESILGARAKPDYKINAETGCWEWQKFLLRGYGQAGRAKAHHLYWERATGREVPPDHHIHHVCENRRCVNPAHLELLTDRDHFAQHYLTKRGLSLDDVREIRRLGRETLLSASEVAERYGLARWSVRRYWNATSWAEADGDERIVNPSRVCAREGCDELVVGRRRDARYCSTDCQSRQRRTPEIAPFHQPEETR